MSSTEAYDVIVIGAGHAGCEAAMAAAKMGAATLLLTPNLDYTAFMACNPSLGGPGKGHLVKEIDALGGIMGVLGDENALQVRKLNTGKGPAVQALRMQVDKQAYQRGMKKKLESQPRLFLREGAVEELLVDNGQVKGVVTRYQTTFYAPRVVLCAGVYLHSEIYVGQSYYSAAPGNQNPSQGLGDALLSLGFEAHRLKTDTPPRVYGNSINYQVLPRVEGEENTGSFSFSTPPKEKWEQLPCYLTYTNESTHQLIQEHLNDAPFYSGLIEGKGPRYCPSIEDKVVRFPERNRHPIFIEPESVESEEMYLQGISTGLPEELQQDLLRSVPGLEEVVITRPAYAIEYDFFPPVQLKSTLETKKIDGLFFAGQVNGTTGYEEAAAQGLMAGINAALQFRGEPPFILERTEAYLGVLIDDLITKGVTEPYRMFTSRCEYRLLLRHDNADLRLMDKGYRLGLIQEGTYQRFVEKRRRLEEEKKNLRSFRLTPSASINSYLENKGYPPLSQPQTLGDLLKRPGINYTQLEEISADLGGPSLSADREIAGEVETQIKYEGYLARQEASLNQVSRMENKKIPENIDYDTLPNISMEARQRLKEVRPRTLGQASRIEGVTPADISTLALYLERKWRVEDKEK